jgi:hypothetical protein
MAEWAVTTAAARLEFDTGQGWYNSCYQIDTNHFINFWAGPGSDGFTQVFTVNTSTWAVTTAAASLEFDVDVGRFHSCYQIDSNHFINFWGGLDYDGFTQVFTVNTSTWAVTRAGARLEFDTVNGWYNSCYQIDTNHFINFWEGWVGSAAVGFVQVFEVNTSTWAVTTAAARLEFDTVNDYVNSCYQVDSNHFINFWGGAGSDGFTQVFTVNTSTWAVTTAAARLEFDTVNDYVNSCYQVDSNHFINFWGGAGSDGFTQVFTVNTSTWAVTTAAARLEFDTDHGWYDSCYQIDNNHFINFWSGPDDDGFTQVFTVNTSTWAVTTAAASLEFDTVNGNYHSCYQIDSNHFINFWGGKDDDGYVQVFEVEVPSGREDQNVSVPTAKLVLKGLALSLSTITSIAAPTAKLVLKGLTVVVGAYNTLANIAVPTTKLVMKGLTPVIQGTVKISISLGRLVIKQLTTIIKAITNWENLPKHTTNWTNETKHTTNWTNETKHTTNWTNETKHKQG